MKKKLSLGLILIFSGFFIIFFKSSFRVKRILARASPSQPIGFHDSSVSLCTINGWTCDADKFEQPLKVQFFERETLIGESIADREREPAVGSSCGGYANHGFLYTFSSPLYHEITVKAVDIDSNGQETGLAKPLEQTPREILCSPLKFPKFFSSNPEFDSNLNEFFYRHFSAMVSPNAYTQPQTEWRDWDAITSIWINTGVNKIPNNGGYNVKDSRCGYPASCTLQLDYNQELKDDLLNVPFKCSYG